MAIAKMTKIMVVTHRSEAKDLIEALQHEGITQILDAEKAMVSKNWPELQIETKRPREVEDMVLRLEKAITFLKQHATEKDATSVFSPLITVEKSRYMEVISGKDAINLLERTEKTSEAIQRSNTDYENKQGVFESLIPWKNLDLPVEELNELSTSVCLVGMIPHQYYDEAVANLSEFEAAIQQVGSTGNMHACLVVARNNAVADVQKVLRSTDFETMSFEDMTGTVNDLLVDCEEELAKIGIELGEATKDAAELAKERLTLQILFDHYENLLVREQTRKNAPATDHTVLLEGWVKTKEYTRLEETVAKFSASNVVKIDLAEGEEPPVEIDNGKASQPFEVVTRLYGMPASSDVDPTALLAPFFALFFGICLTDAAYGLIMIAFLWWIMRKIKGDKKFFMMLSFCSIVTVVTGALTGGWCGDAIQQFVPGLDGVRKSLMWFDPLEKPMYFFNISLALGYLQILFGILIGFIHKMRRGETIDAVFDHLSWFVWLNCLLVFALGKTGLLPGWLGSVALYIAIVPALAIILFSEREGGWGGRIGMGIYNVFSTVFYIGDILSYIRLMALGMVTAGFGMAINEIVKQVMGMGFFGWILGALIFIGGHVFNIANSSLSSFVHSMRLQFVEFFTKFLTGGGKQFEPLRRSYKYIEVEKQ